MPSREAKFGEMAFTQPGLRHGGGLACWFAPRVHFWRVLSVPQSGIPCCLAKLPPPLPAGGCLDVYSVVVYLLAKITVWKQGFGCTLTKLYRNNCPSGLQFFGMPVTDLHKFHKSPEKTVEHDARKKAWYILTKNVRTPTNDLE